MIQIVDDGVVFNVLTGDRKEREKEEGRKQGREAGKRKAAS